MQENWPSGSGSTSNFGQQDVESYLQTIGVWEENEAHTKLNAKWSKIAQSVDSVTMLVRVVLLQAHLLLQNSSWLYRRLVILKQR